MSSALIGLENTARWHGEKAMSAYLSGYLDKYRRHITVFDALQELVKFYHEFHGD